MQARPRRTQSLVYFWRGAAARPGRSNTFFRPIHTGRAVGDKIVAQFRRDKVTELNDIWEGIELRSALVEFGLDFRYVASLRII